MSLSQKPAGTRRFLSYYQPYKALLAADLAASVLVAALGLILPLCVRHITGVVLQSGADVLPGILYTGGLMLAVIAARTACGIFTDYKGHDMGAKIERDLRAELFAHYQKLPFSFYDNRSTGELMSRLTGDLHDLSEVYHHVPEMALTLGIQVIGSLVILAVINLKLACVVLAILPLMAAYSLVFYRKLQKSYQANRERIADMNALVQENLSGIRTVKSFANEPAEIEAFADGNRRYYLSRKGIYRSEALLYAVVEHFFTPFITVAIAAAGGIWISQGTLDIANLLAFIMYAAYLTGPIPTLASMVPYYQQGWSGYRRFREIMETAPDIRDADDAAELQVTEGRVTFDRVTFRYGEASADVLQDISLEVNPGETVAVTGISGIGKTTLCSLIPRFYDVTGGAVRIDGTDVRQVTQASLRRQIGIVQQDTFLLSGTVMENILYGRPGASPEEAVEAAKQANAHDFIMALPQGYDTAVGPRGVKLSGGQRQRISIARVFLKNPPILILDEATSALDSQSEQAVMDSLKTLAKGRTAFIIAHRESTVRNADRVIDMHVGG
jgi:ATP-binding cassette subfamily B protein